VTDRFVYHCTLRWSDLDAYGHINNSRFLTLYEEQVRVDVPGPGVGWACSPTEW
jgi:acyl-CoA thioesterase FadM